MDDRFLPVLLLAQVVKRKSQKASVKQRFEVLAKVKKRFRKNYAGLVRQKERAEAEEILLSIDQE